MTPTLRVLLVAGALVVSAPMTGFAMTSSEYGPARKLGRGLSNIGTSIFEVPLRISGAYHDSGAAAALTWGVVSGLKWMVLRIGAGVLETLTFPFPGPTKDFRPIIEPEFLLNPDDPVLWP